MDFIEIENMLDKAKENTASNEKMIAKYKDEALRIKKLVEDYVTSKKTDIDKLLEFTKTVSSLSHSYNIPFNMSFNIFERNQGCYIGFLNIFVADECINVEFDDCVNHTLSMKEFVKNRSSFDFFVNTFLYKDDSWYTDFIDKRIEERKNQIIEELKKVPGAIKVKPKEKKVLNVAVTVKADVDVKEVETAINQVLEEKFN